MSLRRGLQLHGSRPLLGRGRAAARAGIVALALLLALARAALIPAPAAAQEGQPPRAGLVVDFGNGTVITRCVDLGPSGQATGEQVLRAAGLTLTAEYSAMGAAICSIEGVGCNYPMQPCWCQCTSSPCVYWIYYHLVNGQWVYSNLGASSYIVRAGDVEGWVWGAGTFNQGALPPVRTFAEICAPPTATPTPTATATATPTPLPTDTPTPWPTATDTPPPTATWTPTATAGGAPLATPTATAAPSATPTASPRAPTATPVATPTATPQPPGVSGEPLPPSSPEPPTTVEAPTTPDTSVVGNAFLPLLEHSNGLGASSAPPDASAQPTAALGPTALSSAPASSVPKAVALAPPRQPLSREEVAAALAARGLPRTAPTGTGAAQAWGPAAVAAVTRATWDPVFAGALAAVVAAGLAGARRLRRRSTAEGGARSSAVAELDVRRRDHGGLAWSSGLIYVLCLLLGIVALLYPFLQATAPTTPNMGQARAADAPLLMAVLVGLIFLVMLAEVQEQAVSAKTMALLGVLVAINSVLRFIEVAIPGPGGFTPIWVLIVLAGYVYGARFGFLMGALTLAVSAVITGGVGPWLPAQMFTAGWMGLSAPLARPLVRAVGGQAGSRREVWALAAFAGLWGLIYGVIINLWFWPFMMGPPDQYYQAGLGLAEVVRRYATFYVLTSLVWDSMAVVGNVALTLAFAASILSALRRFQQRFNFEYRPWAAQARP